jgi:molybdopterin synthase sulfur carrier subunit
MANDPRRAAGHRLCSECIRRRRRFWFEAHVVPTVLDFISNKIPRNQQVASNKKELIVPMIFHIPGALREYAGGQRKLVIEHAPATLAEALSALWLLYPGLRDRVLTEQGQLREHVNIFIGDEDVRYTGGLMSPVSSGSEISIVPAISGGG